MGERGLLTVRGAWTGVQAACRCESTLQDSSCSFDCRACRPIARQTLCGWVSGAPSPSTLSLRGRGESRCGEPAELAAGAGAMLRICRRPPSRSRIDTLLVERGLVESRQQARADPAGGRDPRRRRAGDQARRPRRRPARRSRCCSAPPTSAAAATSWRTRCDVFGIDPTGMTCVDVGASTGGFTDCLLQHGARTRLRRRRRLRRARLPSAPGRARRRHGAHQRARPRAAAGGMRPRRLRRVVHRPREGDPGRVPLAEAGRDAWSCCSSRSSRRGARRSARRASSRTRRCTPP